MNALSTGLHKGRLWGHSTSVALALAALLGLARSAGAGEPLSVTPADGSASAGSATPTVAPGSSLPKGKQTVLGLYLTAKEAYEKWQAAPGTVTILDVRTPEEYLFVGHAPMAWLVPVAVQTWEWDAGKKAFPMKPLPDFVERVRTVAGPDATVLVMCRSGSRSAIAVNLLARAGFTNAYNVTDGMEGDTVDDPESVFLGQRLRNGWKNSGLPWTYQTTPEKMVLPKAP